MQHGEQAVAPARRGRPPRADVRASKRREFLLTENEDKALEEVAAELARPVADVIRAAVNGFVGDYSERRIFRRVSSGKKSAPRPS